MSNYKAQNLSTMDFPPAQGVSMDIEAFDELIRSQGVEMVHMKAQKCPIGMIDQYDIRILHDHPNCSNGFLYNRAGNLRALFTSNNKQMQQQDVGLLDHSSASVTVPSSYDICNNSQPKTIKVVPFDRFYLADQKVTVIHWQLFNSSGNGYEKLSFPVECVEYLVDSDGKEYKENVDFDLVDGKIHWLTQNRPSYVPDLNKGQVCSIRYEYRPYYYVSRMIHEVRLTQHEHPVTGERVTVLMPQAFVLVREYVFEKENFDSDSGVPANPRSQKLPEGSQY